MTELPFAEASLFIFVKKAKQKQAAINVTSRRKSLMLLLLLLGDLREKDVLGKTSSLAPKLPI